MFGLFRLFLAINVVAYHILNIPTIGEYAVYSFFILSGYLMTTIMHKTYGFNYLGVKKYFLNRFLRLYPIYWLLLLVSYFIFIYIGFEFASSFHSKIHSPENISQLFSNIFMIYPDIKPVQYPVRLAPATWALTIELFFYVLIGLGISRNKFLTHLWFLASFIYVAYGIIFYSRWVSGYGDIFSASFPFSIGALIYFYKDITANLLQKIPYHFPITLLLFLSNILFIAIIGLYLKQYHWHATILGTYINLGLTFLLIIMLNNIRPMTLSKKVDQFSGDLSYPLYIIHIAGAALAAWIIYGEPQKGFSTQGLSIFIIGCLISFVISIFVTLTANYQIEKIRSRIKQK